MVRVVRACDRSGFILTVVGCDISASFFDLVGIFLFIDELSTADLFSFPFLKPSKYETAPSLDRI